MRIRFLKDYPGTGHRKGEVVEVDKSFGVALLGAGIVQEAPAPEPAGASTPAPTTVDIEPAPTTSRKKTPKKSRTK